MSIRQGASLVVPIKVVAPLLRSTLGTAEVEMSQLDA